jgi:hypothetical protein
MGAERSENASDGGGFQDVDHPERKLFELLVISRRVHLPLEKLIDDFAQNRALFGSPLDILGMHGHDARLNTYAT